MTLKRFEGKNYGYYVIVPNMIPEEKKKDSKRTFFLRIFASEVVSWKNLLKRLMSRRCRRLSKNRWTEVGKLKMREGRGELKERATRIGVRIHSIS